MTQAAALLPLPALDLLIVIVLAGVVWRVRRPRGATRWRVGRAAVALVGLTAALWLAFLGLWGWHYQVPTIEQRLAITRSDLDGAAAESTALTIVSQLNDLHASAHASVWPAPADLPAVLAPHLARVLPTVGVARAPALVPPRRTLLDIYFRSAGIDGMTNPFGLEVLLNSRVLPVELPALAAHEYAHLAGFADESDASVVAWLACMDGGPSLRYSGALAVLPHLVAGLSHDVRQRVMRQLGEGPRADLRAIAARLAEQRPWVHTLAWQSYDRFLKVNRVEEGVARYDAVARVLIAAGDPATGRLRRFPRPWPSARP